METTGTHQPGTREPETSGADTAARPDSSYGQYCPVSRALDVLGERWSMLIVRDMLIGATRFNDLARGLPGLSRSLLTKRLRQLEHAGVVERLHGHYLLTDAGRDLRPIVFGLGDWGARWAFPIPTPKNSTRSCWCGGCTPGSTPRRFRASGR